MLKQIQGENNDQLVLRADEKRMNLIVGMVIFAVGVGILIYQVSGITLLALVFTAMLAGLFLFVTPALKVWTFDRATNTVRYEREATFGSPIISTYAFSDIVEMRLSSPVPAWLEVLAALGSQPTSTPTLTMKVREGERTKKYVMATHLNRKDLDLLMKQIKEFVGEGKPKNSVKDKVS